MAASKAKTVDAYLKELPADRRAEIAAVLELVRKHLPRGYEETVAYGMIGWQVPLAAYPDTHNKLPLGFVGLAAQKNYNSLYLVGCCMEPAQEKRLKDAYRKAGRKLDMGKSCLRFRRADELPADVIGELIAEVSPDDMIAIYEKARLKA